jgi:hypothetical protein
MRYLAAPMRAARRRSIEVSDGRSRPADAVAESVLLASAFKGVAILCLRRRSAGLSAEAGMDTHAPGPMARTTPHRLRRRFA